MKLLIICLLLNIAMTAAMLKDREPAWACLIILVFGVPIVVILFCAFVLVNLRDYLCQLVLHLKKRARKTNDRYK